VKLLVAVTDQRWYDYLAAISPDEVNFWAPNNTDSVRAISRGDLFLFKLHSPQNYIAGGGFFVSSLPLPLSVAWDTFERNNGADSFAEFARIIQSHRPAYEPNPTIGCRVISGPFFFDRHDWIPTPASFAPNIMSTKAYDTSDGDGRMLFEAVTARLASTAIVRERRYGEPQLVAPRLGQGGFRVLVTEAYNRRCAMTGERTLPVLEAAHIMPYAKDGPHDPRNGLLLRSDLHTLFDTGYVTVDSRDLTVAVSSRIKKEFENGRDYYALHGQPLRVTPRNDDLRPSPDFLAWHNQEVFRP
jgi:putative restriction endonuclease